MNEIKNEIIQALENKEKISFNFVIDSVARNGMSRRVRLYLLKDDYPYNITTEVAELLGYPYKKSAMLIIGCGLDTLHYTLYNLAAKLNIENASLSYNLL